MGKLKKRLPELEVFSGIAILMVVLIHSNAHYLLIVLNLQAYTDANFVVRLLDNFIHAAVPIFIFISGYKYATNNINDEYKSYAIKRVKSIIIPFVIISIIFLIKDIIVNVESFNAKHIIIEFINIFRGYNKAYQLWYIPMYIYISLTYPIIYKKFTNDRLRIIIILLIIFIQNILGVKYSFFASYPFSFVYYYIFFEMGLIFCKYDVKNKITKWDAKIICIYILAVGTLTYNPIPKAYEVIQLYLLWPLSVVAYYLLSLRLINNKILKKMGKYSFPIFLLHEPIICTDISYAFKNLGVYNPIIYVFITTILTIVCTLVVYKVIKKILKTLKIEEII